ncbi:MAG: serine/threonine protein phosphatase [Massilia sp.]|nr:serine/threonine protein phosphatase [Massilia sp.]
MTCDSRLRWTSAAVTDVGLVRSRNEDSFLAQPARGVWAVADGMGGHAFGDIASRMVVEAIESLGAPDNMAQFVAAAGERLVWVNRQLRDEALARRVTVMGSTVVVLLACGDELSCLWAGDSRIYLYRNARLQQLTRDHSQAEEFRARGTPPGLEISAAIANMITRAVGAADTLDVDLATLEAVDGDMLLLCSDGLSNPVDEHAIAQALALGDCAQAAQALVALALANGGRDNITVVVVRADDVGSDRTMVNPAL